MKKAKNVKVIHARCPVPESKIAELRRLHEGAKLSELTSTHIVTNGYTHLANLTTAPDKPCFVVMERKEVMDWFAAIHNASPSILDELEALREEVRRLREIVTAPREYGKPGRIGEGGSRG